VVSFVASRGALGAASDAALSLSLDSLASVVTECGASCGEEQAFITPMNNKRRAPRSAFHRSA
jgi:hypothetical protein